MVKKKGQISLEILIILGILVIGAIVFSIIFITNVRQQSKVDDNIEMDNFIDDFKKDLNANASGIEDVLINPYSIDNSELLSLKL